MKAEEFLREYPILIASDYGESEFAAIKILCPGLSTPKLGKILNRAAYYMEPTEVYCEIGTFCGYTLISASMNNLDKQFIGIDNFCLLGLKTTEGHSEFVRKRLKTNLDHFYFGNQHVIDSDFRRVDVQAPIGVFYIDGTHTYEEVLENFSWAHKRLSDDAIVFIDDISMAGVGEAVTEWVKNNKEYKEIFRMDVFYKKGEICHTNPVFWNGLSIVRFKREKPDGKTA